MSQRTIVHDTFTLEREYALAPDRIFAAWADESVKRRWFARGNVEYQLDFRVDGLERNSVRHDGKKIDWESRYREVVPAERIVYSSTLSVDGTVVTVSQATVEFVPTGVGTKLVLVEQGAYLDGHEQHEWRQQGTSDWLDALASAFEAASS